jgi:putative addiction module component (TIGR02574 family)
MKSNLDDVEQMAMALDPTDRVTLAGRLIDSVRQEEPATIDAAWAEEAERRLDEFLAGRMRGIPADEVYREAEARLRR